MGQYTKINPSRYTNTRNNMLTRPERRAAGIMIIVVLLLAGMYIGTTYMFPDGGAVPYRDDKPDGTHVYLEGIVLDTKITGTGGHLIVNVSGVDVFIPKGGTELILLLGDHVRVIGNVDTYAGKKEIIIHSMSDIRILV